MPFHALDNVTTWIYSVFTEEYENEDAERQKSLMSAITDCGTYPLVAYTADIISNMISNDMLAAAVENSVDFHLLKRLLTEWADDTTCPKCYHYTDKCYRDTDHCDQCEGEAEGSDTDA